MNRFRPLAATLPYWCAGFGCYAPVLLRRLDKPDSYSHFEYAIAEATESPVVAAIGFALISIVFYLWRPQTKLQLGFGIVVSLLLFIGPAFSNVRVPADYFLRTFEFRADCGIIATCMVISQILPLTAAYLSRIRLVHRSESASDDHQIRRGVSIWELFFLTFCCAVSGALVASVVRESLVKTFSSADYFRQAGAAPLILCGMTSLVSLTLLDRLEVGRWRWMWIGLAGVVFVLASTVGACCSSYDPWPDFSKAYIIRSVGYHAGALFLVSTTSLLAFIGPLLALGYRLRNVEASKSPNSRGPTL